MLFQFYSCKQYNFMGGKKTEPAKPMHELMLSVWFTAKVKLLYLFLCTGVRVVMPVDLLA